MSPDDDEVEEDVEHEEEPEVDEDALPRPRRPYVDDPKEAVVESENWQMRAERAERELMRLVQAWRQESDDIEQMLGKALHFPWYVDDLKNFPHATAAHGVCVGEHVAITMAMAAVRRIAELEGVTTPLPWERDERQLLLPFEES